ncbi:MAG: hydantoinase/oxoprolinase N-terminal domain-containing protein [Planctomycetaceae bacterium]
MCSHEQAPILAIRSILGLRLDQPIPQVAVRLGTTRGTNALLERRGARTALITTKGFADALLIGNQDRPRLFDLAIRKPEPLFNAVIEIEERVDAEECAYCRNRIGRWSDSSLLDLRRSQRVESVAICLLHSYRFREHEERVADDRAGGRIRRGQSILGHLPVNQVCLTGRYDCT